MALDDAMKCGFHRVLVNTERYCSDGSQLASSLQEQAKGRIAIIPGKEGDVTKLQRSNGNF